MPLTVTVNTIAECLRTECNILGDKLKKKKSFRGTQPVCIHTIGLNKPKVMSNGKKKLAIL